MQLIIFFSFENNMQRQTKVMKRERKGIDVAESSWTETQGKCNNIHSTDPGNNVPEDVDVRKRRAGDDVEMPLKRRRCSNLTISTDHSDGSVENTRIKRCKKKASVHAELHLRKWRCNINNTYTTNSSVGYASVEINEGKASDDSEAPDKNIRFSDSSSSHNSFIPVPSFKDIKLKWRQIKVLITSATTSVALPLRRRKSLRCPLQETQAEINWLFYTRIMWIQVGLWVKI